MATLDPRIEAVRKEYGLAAADFWELPQKKGTWVAKHAALEVAAAKAGIVFAPPQVLEANGEAKSVALCVTGTLKDRSEWSVGEASPANNKNAYPYAMAEKRAKDRVILKLIGLHGLAYSEDEADDFKAPAPAPEAPKAAAPAPSQPSPPDAYTKAKEWVTAAEAAIATLKTREAMAKWMHLNIGALDKVREADKGLYDAINIKISQRNSFIEEMAAA